jgi:hypothetical protein
MQSNRLRNRQKLEQTEGTETKVPSGSEPIVDEITGIKVPEGVLVNDENIVGTEVIEEVKPEIIVKPEANINIKLSSWDDVKVDIVDPTNGNLVNVKNWKITQRYVLRSILKFKKASYHNGVKNA